MLSANGQASRSQFSDGLLAPPCFRFHTPLIEPDVRICRIRLSEKTHAIAVAIACDADSLTLRPARTPSRLATLCTRGFSSFVASTVALIATGWSEPVPGAPGNRLTDGVLYSQS